MALRNVIITFVALTLSAYAVDTTTINVGTDQSYPALYGEMYVYDGTTATVINATNQYHALTVPVTGSVSGWTFQAGLTGTIASAASSDGGTTVTFTDVAHGLLTGEYVTITGTTDYNGNFLVTKLTDDTFKVTDTWVSNQSGQWQRGANLKANTGSAGTYRLAWNMTADAAANSKEIKVEPVLNTTHQDKAASQRVFGTGGDWGQLVGGCIVTVAAGDIIYLQAKNVTDDTDFTVKHSNLSITKL